MSASLSHFRKVSHIVCCLEQCPEAHQGSQNAIPVGIPGMDPSAATVGTLGTADAHRAVDNSEILGYCWHELNIHFAADPDAF